MTGLRACLLRGLSLWLVGSGAAWELRVSPGTGKVAGPGASTDPHGQVCSRLPSRLPHLEWGPAPGEFVEVGTFPGGREWQGWEDPVLHCLGTVLS